MSTSGGTRGRRTRVLTSLLMSLLGVAVFAAVPWMVGVSWAVVVETLRLVGPAHLLVLLGVWGAGLLVHCLVLTGALPGLTVRRALLLNLSGSAVSNLLPLGGAAGMGLGFAMSRRWGFPGERFASFTLVSNLWNAVGKLVVGVSLLAAAALAGTAFPPGTAGLVLSACAAVSVVLLTSLVVLGSDRVSRVVVRVLGRLLGRPGRWQDDVGTRLRATRRTVVDVVSGAWARMSLGVLGYMALQGLLLALSLAAVGAGASLAVVLTAFAVERLVALVPVTPASNGLAELGTVAVLTALGTEPVAAASGVVLYRLLLVGLEIPVGGLLVAWWWRAARLADRKAVQVTRAPGVTVA
jgi:uncharacterized membrane protein YbhN (UPF0104 family)